MELNGSDSKKNRKLSTRRIVVEVTKAIPMDDKVALLSRMDWNATESGIDIKRSRFGSGWGVHN